MNLDAGAISIAFIPELLPISGCPGHHPGGRIYESGHRRHLHRFHSRALTNIGVGHTAGRLAELQGSSSGAHHSIVAAVVLKLFAATFSLSQAINFLVSTHLDGKPLNFENLVSVVGYALVCPIGTWRTNSRSTTQGSFSTFAATSSCRSRARRRVQSSISR
ncbi:hypothetical protein T492DRAFT_107130 [Pavlovales sp. CCMP2436]|nr:hypothetical protein T492DRAFT_107130 [Pavlovales sp. CCMP2436]